MDIVFFIFFAINQGCRLIFTINYSFSIKIFEIHSVKILRTVKYHLGINSYFIDWG